MPVWCNGALINSAPKVMPDVTWEGWVKISCFCVASQCACAALLARTADSSGLCDLESGVWDRGGC